MAPPKKGELTQEEKELLEAIGQGNVQEAGRLLGSKNVRVNCLDEHGMTPLMHAAYKGKMDMCRMLLRHGANVNCNEHEHGYTALMFAGLSGNKEITRVMLEAGADTDVVNSVGRTAAQMAAFIVMLVKENPLLAEEDALKRCYRVMDLICEKCMKQRDMNEVLAMKVHYISCIFQKCIQFLTEREDKLDGFIKSLLKGRETDGFPVYQEKFIRECIRKFPYCETTLLQQLVRSIAPVEIGSDPTAFSVLTQAITGQVGFVDVEFCTTCGEKGADKRCSMCKMVIYCNQNCQKIHWFTHKKVCKVLKAAYEKQELEAAKDKKRQEEGPAQEKEPDVDSNSSNEEQPETDPGDTKEDPTDLAQEEKAHVKEAPQITPGAAGDTGVQGMDPLAAPCVELANCKCSSFISEEDQ
ncbi:ankyrin repeat and MYND domain-containing protein 2 isoform X2 [Vombatus ursinus]|uniref:ankyrin repeat and MYND domain-containing protein 2 isoform X2 n=1 Tax=Vombatus ursinus TaxID=29139 RepID=UPI000FFD54BE|nr:ankyrin repeat and MYND domain-containing protein 2 isoform X2 [Vombatus ursinus]